MYDENGHLIGEYDKKGNPRQETVWLNGLPVGASTKKGNYFVVPGPDDEPVMVLDKAGNQVWAWKHDYFGAPSLDKGPLTFNLRDHDRYDTLKGIFLGNNKAASYLPDTGRFVQPANQTAGKNPYLLAPGSTSHGPRSPRY